MREIKNGIEFIVKSFRRRVNEWIILMVKEGVFLVLVRLEEEEEDKVECGVKMFFLWFFFGFKFNIIFGIFCGKS